MLRLVVALGLLPLFASGQEIKRPTLADERINALFQKAKPYQRAGVVYFAGAVNSPFGSWIPRDREIGPIGQRHTLATHEFPWAHPGGTFGSAKTVKLKLSTPESRGTAFEKKFWNNRTARHDLIERPAWKWREGSVYFEIHYHRTKGHPFEVRVQEKTGDGVGVDNWEYRVFRPYQLESDLPIEPQRRIREKLSIDSGHPRNPFKAEGVRFVYEDQPVDWMKEVMSREWPDDTGHEWHHAGQGEGWVSNRNYHGWVTGSDREGCVKCHALFGKSVDFFEAVRDWYGFVQGYDSVASDIPPGVKAIPMRVMEPGR